MNADNNPNTSAINAEQVLKKAFFYWKSTFVFQLVVTVLYFSITLIAGVQLAHYYFGSQLEGFSPDVLQKPDVFVAKMNAIMASENGQYFQIVFPLIKAAMFPLGVGLFRVYSVLDEQKTPTFSHLLEGYMGSNFFKFWGYSIFWTVVFQIGMSLFFLPGILWIMATLFVGPLLFFTPMRMMEAFNISAKVVMANWVVVFPCALVAFLFSYAGLMVFFIGFLFTYPFWNAVIYTLFKKYFNIKFV